MGKKNSRWMTWVLEESARPQATMPWARGTRPNWRKNLSVETPDLARILDDGLRLARTPHRRTAS